MTRGHPPKQGTVAALEQILDGTGPLRDAACRGHSDLFDPRNLETSESHSSARERHELAIAICRACPALDPCRLWADAEPDRGSVLAARMPSTAPASRPRKDPAA